MALNSRNLNYKAILKLNGIILLIVGVSMIPALLCALYYDEPATATGILKSMAVIVPLGLILFFSMRFSKTIFRARDGYIAVATCWITACIFGVLPYIFTGLTDSFIDALFESTAGISTTGSSVLDVTLFSKGMLMWKATSNWIGGMGILIFIISVFPALGINGQVIARLETPSPVLEKSAIRMTDTAKILYITYIVFTLLEFVLLELGSSMSTFDALANSMSCISTGGLFLHPGGLDYYGSNYVDFIICVFAVIGSINFLMYFYLIKRNFKAIAKDTELRVFLLVLAAAIVIGFVSLWNSGDMAPGEAFKISAVQVVSNMTTAGFSYTSIIWPSTCQMLLLILMFTGGCSASTSGSLKIVRVIFLFKYIRRGMFRKIHPRAIRTIKLNGRPVAPPVVSAIAVFILTFFGFFLLSCVILSTQGYNFTTTMSTSIAILSNCGLALNDSGALIDNFSDFSGPLKVYMCLMMLVGRLELFTMIIFFTRAFWDRKK